MRVFTLSEDMRIEVQQAQDALMGRYPPLTLTYYDAGPKSPRDRVTVEDLGRVLIFGGFRGWKSATAILEAGESAPWTEVPADLRLADHADLSPSEWLQLPDVKGAYRLFSHLAGYERNAQREAGTSKLLHLKWPHFFPIIDGKIRTRFGHDAAAFQRHISSRQSASTLAFWLWFRSGLTQKGNEEALTALQGQLGAQIGAATEESPQLGGLTRLRLYDAIVWLAADGAFEN